MASSKHTTPERNAHDWLTNSKLILINLGGELAEFKVHAALLKSTSFFDVERPSGVVETPSEASRTNSDHTEDSSQPGKCIDAHNHPENRTSLPLFMEEDGTESHAPAQSEVKSEDDPIFVSSTKRSSGFEMHYRFPAKGIFCPKSFKMFLEYLYTKVLDQNVDNVTRQVFLKTWLIASRYKCPTLQNELMNKLRNYYLDHMVTLQDLQWVARRTNSNGSCKLLAYLVEQTAFQALSHVSDESGPSSLDVEAFWRTGEHPLRFLLFRAIVRMGQVKRVRNPASTLSRKWFV